MGDELLDPRLVLHRRVADDVLDGRRVRRRGGCGVVRVLPPTPGGALKKLEQVVGVCNLTHKLLTEPLGVNRGEPAVVHAKADEGQRHLVLAPSLVRSACLGDELAHHPLQRLRDPRLVLGRLRPLTLGAETRVGFSALRGEVRAQPAVLLGEPGEVDERYLPVLERSDSLEGLRHRSPHGRVIRRVLIRLDLQDEHLLLLGLALDERRHHAAARLGHHEIAVLGGLHEALVLVTPHHQVQPRGEVPLADCVLRGVVHAVLVDEHRVEPALGGETRLILGPGPLHVALDREHLVQPRVANVSQAVERQLRVPLSHQHRLYLDLSGAASGQHVLAEVVHQAARGEKIDRAEVLGSGRVVVVSCGEERGRREPGLKTWAPRDLGLTGRSGGPLGPRRTRGRGVRAYRES